MRFILLLFLPLWLAACANLTPFEQPRISVTDVRLRDGKLLSQEFLVTLRVDNPNQYGFSINGAVADVLINDQPLARGLSGQRVSVAGFGSADLGIVTTVQTLSLLKQLMRMGTRQPLAYEVKGHLNVSRGWTRNILIPFKERGSLDFWRFIDEQAIPRPLEP